MGSTGKNWDSIAPPSFCYDRRKHCIHTCQRDALKNAARPDQDRLSISSEKKESRRDDIGGLTSRVPVPLVARPPPGLQPDRKVLAEHSILMAARTQNALFDAHELDGETMNMTLWLQAHAVPLKLRRQVLAHLDTIYLQMTFCRKQLLHGWKLLHPPFYQPNIDSFERMLRFFERSVQLLTSAIEDCKSKILSTEALAACKYIQLWMRRLLAKRGFYTKVVELSFHHRGLVSGMFDSIKGKSKLTAHRQNQSIILEYPRSDHKWDTF